MQEKEPEKYAEFYAAFAKQLKYGTVSEYGAHKDTIKDLLLFHSQKEGKPISLKAYVEAMPEGQEKIYYISGETLDRAAKQPQVQTLTAKGYDVLLFTDEVDEFVAQTLMNYNEKVIVTFNFQFFGVNFLIAVAFRSVYVNVNGHRTVPESSV